MRRIRLIGPDGEERVNGAFEEIKDAIKAQTVEWAGAEDSEGVNNLLLDLHRHTGDLMQSAAYLAGLRAASLGYRMEVHDDARG